MADNTKRFAQEGERLAHFQVAQRDKRYHAENQKRPRNALSKEVVDFLRTRYTRHTHPPGYEACSAEQVRMGTPSRIDIDGLQLRLKLRENERVREDDGTGKFAYKPKYNNVSCKADIVNFLRENNAEGGVPTGLFQQDIETCYPVKEVQDDLQDLIAEMVVHREDNKDKRQKVLFITDPRVGEPNGALAESTQLQLSGHARFPFDVSHEVLSLWNEAGKNPAKTPKELKAELQKHGLKPIQAKQPEKYKPPTKKKRGKK